MRAGVLQLHRWGLLDAVIAAGHPAVRRTTFTFTADRVPITIKPSHGVDALYAPRRTVLDPILVDGARQAGAEVEYGTIVTSVIRDRDGRVNGIRGRGSRRPTGRHWPAGSSAPTVSTPIDRRGGGGARRAAGHRRHGRHLRLLDRPRQPTATSGSSARERCAGTIPTNGGQTCVFAAGPPARIGRRRPSRAARTVSSVASPELADRLAAAHPARHVRTFHGRPASSGGRAGPGWALVGDAGSWKDPIAAHGLTDALRDAELLARALIAADRGADEDMALAAYHETRNRLSLPLFDVVDTIAGLAWTDDEIPGLLLQLSSSMSDEVDTLARLDHPTPLIGARP